MLDLMENGAVRRKAVVQRDHGKLNIDSHFSAVVAREPGSAGGPAELVQLVGFEDERSTRDGSDVLHTGNLGAVRGHSDHAVEGWSALEQPRMLPPPRVQRTHIAVASNGNSHQVLVVVGPHQRGIS